jgi:very-long-chain enoyl-CoA reductase
LFAIVASLLPSSLAAAAVACRCHIILANLRKPGEKAYKIPSGFLFNYITCANYTAEIWGWILFTIGTRTLAAGLFTAAGAFQMADWARGKHRRLQKVRVCFFAKFRG